MIGRSTGREVTSSRTLSGPGIGLELLFRRWATARSGLVVGARHAGLEPPFELRVDQDRYEPLRDGSRETVLYVGARFGR